MCAFILESRTLLCGKKRMCGWWAANEDTGYWVSHGCYWHITFPMCVFWWVHIRVIKRILVALQRGSCRPVLNLFWTCLDYVSIGYNKSRPNYQCILDLLSPPRDISLETALGSWPRREWMTFGLLINYPSCKCWFLFSKFMHSLISVYISCTILLLLIEIIIILTFYIVRLRLFGYSVFTHHFWTQCWLSHCHGYHIQSELLWKSHLILVIDYWHSDMKCQNYRQKALHGYGRHSNCRIVNASCQLLIFKPKPQQSGIIWHLNATSSVFSKARYKQKIV